MSVTKQTAAQLQAAHPTVPPEKLEQMTGRTAIGALFVGIGLVLLAGGAGVGLYLIVRAQPSLLILSALGILAGAGLLMVIFGATVWSSQLMKSPMKLVAAFFAAIVRTIRGKNGAPPDDPLASGTHPALKP